MARIISTPFSETQNPAWAGDFFSRDHLVPGGATLDLTAFAAIAGVPIQTAAAALAAATSLTVDPLPADIPSGTVLNFGGAKYAKTTALALAGATTLAVEALGVAIADDDVAYYNSLLGGVVQVSNGTLVGRTYAERDAGADFGPADAADDEVFIVVFDIEDLNLNREVDLYRHRSIVKENYLPGWATLAAGLKTKVRALYQTTRGVN